MEVPAPPASMDSVVSVQKVNSKDLPSTSYKLVVGGYTQSKFSVIFVYIFKYFKNGALHHNCKQKNPTR